MNFCVPKYIVCASHYQKSTRYWPGEEHPRQTHGILTVELLGEKPSDIPDVTMHDLTVCITTDVRTAFSLAAHRGFGHMYLVYTTACRVVICKYANLHSPYARIRHDQWLPRCRSNIGIGNVIVGSFLLVLNSMALYAIWNMLCNLISE